MDGLSDDSMMGGEVRAIESRLPPGFRFHPSDEELVCYYLRNKQQQQQTAATTMLVEVDLHACEPWDLPEVAKVAGADEWYFFSLRERKYATGWRRKRASKQGYWKATGKDKPILHQHHQAVAAGARKTLVFYSGRAPNGRKTAWVMHEFRLLHHHHLHPAPTIMSDQDRFSIQLHHQHSSEHFSLDEQHQQQRLHLSVLQAPTSLEFEQAPGDGAMETIIAEMESFETTCASLQDASGYYMQLY